MLPSSEPDRIQIAFDDHRLVSNAGLILPATLAQRLGLGELANNHVDLGDARVRAMLCGARSLYAISQWGRDQGREVSEAVGFTRERTPGVSTLHQVFIRLDREAFELALGRWLQQQRLQGPSSPSEEWLTGSDGARTSRRLQIWSSSGGGISIA